MVPVLGPVAQPENRLHLLGQHEGWRNWFTSLIIWQKRLFMSKCTFDPDRNEGSLLCNYNKYGSCCITQKEIFKFHKKDG